MPILIALIFLLNGASESAEPAKPEKAEPQSKKAELQEKESTKQQTPISPSTVVNNKSSHGQSNAPNTKANAPDQKAQTQPPVDYNWWFSLFLVIFSGCLVGVGIAQVVIYRVQARYMRHNLALTRYAANAARNNAIAARDAAVAVERGAKIAEDTLKAIERQAKIADDGLIETRKAADAAKEAADAAKRQGIIMAALDRPWLIPDKPKITGWPFDPAPPHTIRIQWSVRNFGTSPAFLTKLSIKFGVERWPLPEPPKYDDALPFGDLAIPQNGDHATEKTFTLPENIVRDIEDGNGSVLVYGFLKYHDTLGDEHTTRFCCYWFYPGQRPVFSPTGPPSYMEYT